MLHRLSRKIIQAYRWRRDVLRQKIPPHLCVARIKLRWNVKARQKPHGLPGELIISLTSYPPRYPTLALTLQCLLRQDKKPDRVILWIADKDMAALPESVLSMKSHGLEIRTAPDTGSYKKIIPALQAFPDAFIATADDDLYYRSTWLGDLIAEWNGSPRQIVCHRAHGVQFDAAKAPLPYQQWLHEIPGPEMAAHVFPTSGAGVLYPPHSLDPDVLAEASFRELCPNADDVWLYWMGRRAGSVYKKAKKRHPIIMWPGSQHVALAYENYCDNGNDLKIKNMIGAYGWPVSIANE